jgi:hypothetical protein
MPESSRSARAHTKSVSSEPIPTVSSSKAAIRRCDAAWKRAFDAYIQDNGDDVFSRVTAKMKYACPAYRAAMPALDSIDNVRDFISCTAHGILIDTIPQEYGGQLLYAAQVALGVLRSQANHAAKRKKRTPPPSPQKQPLPEPESVTS